MVKVFFSIVISLFLVIDVQAATEIDSLSEVLKNLSSDDYEALIDVHNNLAWSYRDSRPDSSLYYANAALKMARNHDFEHREIIALNYMGVAYRNLSDFSKAFEKYLEALRLADERMDYEQQGYSLINLGNLYLYQTNFNGAIRYFIQALDQAQFLADQRMAAYCFLNLGRSYRGILEYGQAELYFKQAIKIRNEEGDISGQLISEIELAELYRRMNQHERSLNYYEDLIVRIKELDFQRLLAVAYNNVAKIHLSLGNIERAEENALKALRITHHVISRYEEKDVLENLSKIYESGKGFNKAFEYHVKYAELNQQLFGEDNIRKIEQLKNQYKIEQQEAENEFLRRQSELNQEIISRQRIIIMLTVVGIVLFLIVAILFIRAYRVEKRLSLEIKDQKDKIEKDKELIEQQSTKLKELDEAKSRFFANVSHDLRTPLSLIIGNLDMLKEDEGVVLTNGAQKNLDTGLKNCRRLLYLTDEINDLTKLEEGKINLNRGVVRLASYLEMLTEIFVGTAEQKGIILEFSHTLENEDMVFLDPRQFEKIFYNLISNAIRHTSKGQKITIGAASDADEIYMSISDTGDGIASDSLPYIFDRFYQSKDNVYGVRGGLGIGLALVKELVELHDGTITVESTLGLGTSFKMTFPKAKQETSKGGAIPISYGYVSEQIHVYEEIDRGEAGVSLPRYDQNKQTVLLVDDHPEIRYHIHQILEDDYHVIEAAHGIEALDILGKSEIDLIISDLMMPWMDGFELIKAINSDDEYSSIPLLVVSARISKDDQEKVLFQGINDYLQKPFQKKELVQRINNLLEQKEKWKGNKKEGFADIFDKNRQNRIEKDILSKLEKLVMEKINDENLSVFHLADAMAASERQVYRLVKKITGLTPFEYISEIRMKYVEYLIRKGKVKNASEAARSIGLKNVTTFSRQFEKKFGVKPSEILKAQS